MRTHIELDVEVLNQVMALGRFNTKKAAVQSALAAFADDLKRQQLLKLREKVTWSGDLAALRDSR